MGFFDFLTRPGAPAPTAAGPGARPGHAPGATRALRALLAQPRAQRDPAWSEAFLAQVADAAFFTRQPEVVLGAGRPYFALHTEPAGAAGALPHPSHVIHHLLEDLLLERGLGVVINPVGPDADWAFSYGDLLQFHLHGGFYPARAGAARPHPRRSAAAGAGPPGAAHLSAAAGRGRPGGAPGRHRPRRSRLPGAGVPLFPPGVPGPGCVPGGHGHPGLVPAPQLFVLRGRQPGPPGRRLRAAVNLAVLGPWAGACARPGCHYLG